MSNNKKIEDRFATKGHEIIDFMDNVHITGIKKLIESKLRVITKSKSINIQNYHEYIQSDKEHFSIQYTLSKEIWKKSQIIDFAKSIKNILIPYIGVDFSIQKKPFLRIARPNIESDNIGFHKDTNYGQKLNELSLHVPLMDLNKNNCLKILEDSHIKKIKFLRLKQSHSKGSMKHKLGYPYQPYKLNIDEKDYKAIKLKFGQGLIFTPALIHGQKINRSKITRFSFDIRITNNISLDLKDKKNKSFYYPISLSKNHQLIKFLETK